MADVLITPMYDSQGKLVGYSKVVQDLTERKRLIQERDLSHSRAKTLQIEREDGLRRALENLLMNAIKYGDPAEKIDVNIKCVKDRVLLTVHNKGSPISAAEQAALFEDYQRTYSAEASGEKGWGLGLTLIRGIAEAHGGSTKVESYPIQGTTFTVDLPLDSRPFQTQHQLAG